MILKNTFKGVIMNHPIWCKIIGHRFRYYAKGVVTPIVLKQCTRCSKFTRV